MSRFSTLAALAIALSTGEPARAENATEVKSVVDGTPVTLAAIGETAPDFTLKDTDGKEHRLSEYSDAGKVVVLEWFNPDCPFVRKHHEKNKTMATTYAAFAEKDIVWLAINSGAPGKQGYGLERNQKARKDYGIAYPVLLDETGAVGQLYGAKTTPHMFVIAKSGDLVYAGAIDDNSSPGTLGETNWVSTCLGQVLAGEAVSTSQTKPYGCSVKYAAPGTMP